MEMKMKIETMEYIFLPQNLKNYKLLINMELLLFLLFPELQLHFCKHQPHTSNESIILCDTNSIQIQVPPAGPPKAKRFTVFIRFTTPNRISLIWLHTQPNLLHQRENDFPGFIQENVWSSLLHRQRQMDHFLILPAPLSLEFPIFIFYFCSWTYT